jgi:hypothetical protein
MVINKRVVIHVKKLSFLAILAIFSLQTPGFSEVLTSASSSPSAKTTIKKVLTPESMGTPLTYTSVPTATHADDLKVGISIVKDPGMVGKYFDSKMWRKRFVPFYLSLENTGQYPIEVSTGSILLLEEKTPDPKATTKMAQLSSTKPTASTASKNSKKKAKDLPPFVVPTPPGMAFNKSKHVQYGWKSNLAMIAATGITLGFAAPVTVPAMVMGNMHRGTNKRLANNLQDQNLARLTIEPGDKVNTWLFYRRDRKRQTLLPRKIVFADIYTPSKEELSSFVIDLQPLNTDQTAVRRKMEESEIKDLQLFQGKIVTETKEESASEKLKELESLAGEKKETK